jgi:hypothetical protein
MLYDMIAYSINKGYKELFCTYCAGNKSSVGAKPIPMYGLMQHSNFFINLFISKMFLLQTKIDWQQRNPFKE